MSTRRLLTNILVLATLAVNPATHAGADSDGIEIPFEKFVLDNGLTVIVHEDRKAPIVAVGVWYHVGSKDESVGKTGFAHLFEHIMFEGSENFDDRFSKPLDQVGATSLNGTTWFDRTNYFENVPTPALELALWLESDRMGHLLGVVSQEKLDQERGVVQNEKRQRENQPYGKAWYRILEGVFPPGHPYRHPTIGSMEDLNAASLDDVHQWFRNYYGAANTVLVLAGDIDPRRGRELATRYFGDIPAGPPLTRLKNRVPARTEFTREVMYDRVPHTRSFHYWAVPGWTEKDRLLLTLAASVLGDGKNSRLYQALVYELQLATTLAVEVQPLELASLFSIDVILAAEATLAQINDIIEQELARLFRDGPGEEELQRAKTKINAFVVRGLERVGGFSGKATILAQSELYDGNPDFFKTALDWINNATAEDVRAAASRWLSRGRYQLDVLPFGEYQTVASGVNRSAGLPRVKDLPGLSFPEVQRASLDNGMNVILAEWHAVPVVSLALQFDAGFAADAGLKSGTASLTLAMMDESTRQRTALEIDAEAELLGAEISTRSDLDTSTATLSALKAKLQPSIELFADVVRNPAFSSEELERLRRRWLAAIQREKNDPVDLALRTLPPLIYGAEHAYAIPFTGTGREDSIRQIERQDLLKFYSDWIRPDNASLFVVGDTSMAEILPLLEHNFGDWQAPLSELPVKNITQAELPDQARIIIIDKPDSPQSLILAAHLAPPTLVDNNIELEMMNDIIGGVYAARVNQKLRVEEHWSYGAFTFFKDARGQRPWMVYAPVQTNRTADAVAALSGEIKTFLSEQPATDNELQRVFRSRAYSLPGKYETGNAILGALLANQRFGRPDDYVAGLRQKYAQANLEHIQGAAERTLKPEVLTWVIVGDRSLIEDDLRKLGIAELEFMDSDGNFPEQLEEAGESD